MRLATCVAAELTVGTVLIAAVAGGALWGINELRSEPWWGEPAGRARAEPPRAPPAPPPVTPDPPVLASGGAALVGRPPARPATRRGGSFAGQPDEALLAPLRDAPIARIKIGTCCTSLNMRIDFESGGRAAFKPEQLDPGSMPRKEIAAYRIDRLLGIGAVPPAIPRRFRVEEIVARVVGGSPAEHLRLRTEMVARGGEATGELSWWIPELSKPTIEGQLIDSAEGVALWQRPLMAGNEIAAKHERLLAQISRVLLFDFLINNIDRWSGGNILASKDGSSLYFMDNTTAFRPQPRGHQKVRSYLARSQKFSRSLVAALRRLRLEEVRAAVSHDLGPMEYLLTESEIQALMSRRDAALSYVDGLIAEYGEAAVLRFP